MISHKAATVYIIENVMLSAYCVFPLFVSPNGRHGFCYSFSLLFSNKNFGTMKYSHSFADWGAHSLRSLSFHLPCVQASLQRLKFDLYIWIYISSHCCNIIMSRIWHLDNAHYQILCYIASIHYVQLQNDKLCSIFFCPNVDLNCEPLVC